MQISELNIGKPINVSLIDEDGSTDGYEFASQIVDIIDESEIIISSLFYKSNMVSLNTEENLRITFVHDSGLYAVEGKSIDINSEDGLIFYKINITSEIERIQRREHFRIPVGVPIIYQLTKDGEEIYGQGLTKDISGGGIKFICNQEFHSEDIVNIYLRLAPNMEVSTLGQVIRCVLCEEGKYEICMVFDDLDFNQRESLIKYIFEIQREKIKRK